MDDEKAKFQYSALRWLYELELVQDPQLINNLKMNIFSVSTLIKEVEFLSSYQHRQLLILLDLSWIGKKFFAKKIIPAVEDRVKTLLPKFAIRVITDKVLFESAIEKVKKAFHPEQTSVSPAPAK